MVSDCIREWDDRLDQHFRDLRDRRDGHAPGLPIFALEHGLDATERDRLENDVRAALALERDLGENWLPFVVYATELGYAYAGDEYWPTFAYQTPGWRGDRELVRTTFREFRDRYDGASPSGRWAGQFVIISWPITHAVLPTDLQRHLARLLYESQRSLTSELLASPAELGAHLSARTWGASSRLRSFAQNPDLLGLVASALLVGEGEESPYLLESTLARIVSDLSHEAEARRWLRDAKRAAMQVRIRGLGLRTGSRPNASGSLGTDAGISEADPRLELVREAAGWKLVLELPDLTVLAESIPEIYEQLTSLRVRLAGSSGAPLARGRVLAPGQRFRLDQWPGGGLPLLQLENGSIEVNALLADRCRLSSGPRWVFRVLDIGTAPEVRGKFVRPHRDYVLLSEDEMGYDLPEWIRPAPVVTEGIHAYEISVPEVITADDVELLKGLGVSPVVEVGLRPAGFVAAHWDGEGQAEWIVGERPTVALSVSREVRECLITVNSEPTLISWPAGQRELFLRFDQLGVGGHHIDVGLIASRDEGVFAEGSLDILMRSPQARPSTGTVREGLVILSTPLNPSLEELWDGGALLDVRGPSGTRATVTMALEDRSRRPRASFQVGTGLPLLGKDWPRVFRQFTARENVQRFFDEAASCLVEVRHPQIGTVSLRSEREFSPLRWAAGTSDDGPFVRLIDHFEGGDALVHLREFGSPDLVRTVAVDENSRFRNTAGGLITATKNQHHASVVLPPDIRNFIDLEVMRGVPRLTPVPRSLDSIDRLARTYEVWSDTGRPANPFGAMRQTAVLRAIVSYIAGLIGGTHWKALEARLDGEDEPTLAELRRGIGDERRARGFGVDLERQIEQLVTMLPERRGFPVASVIANHAGHIVRDHRPRFADFVLRLASDPSSLASCPQEDLRYWTDLVLDTPLLLRGARFVVLAVEAGMPPDALGVYRGWAWE